MSNKQLEAQRQQLQIELDKHKSLQQRNQLGQFSTPNPLAVAIVEQSLRYAQANNSNKKIQFLDPAIGTGAFYSALLEVIDNKSCKTCIKTATGFELDPYYANPAKTLWQSSGLHYHIADFTQTKMPATEQTVNQQYNLIICNPPYIRHHDIKQNKKQLQQQAKISANMSLSGRAGLHCYFMALSHQWMSKAGIGAWLIPSEFMDVNYGQGIKDYLLNQVSLLHIHRFDATTMQFNDALVSSAIVWFKNLKPKKNHQIRLTFGDLQTPSIDKTLTSTMLANISKWTQAFENKPQRTPKSSDKTLGDYFTIKRGIATGDNQFFILSQSKIEQLKLPISQFRPMLPSPRHLQHPVIESNKNGHPIISDSKQPALFVLDCHLSMDDISNQYPKLYNYLQQGITQSVNQRYLCRHRKLWYRQENRPSSYFYCSYIGRADGGKTNVNNNPFKFILNQSNAIVTNSYLILYPKKLIADQIASDNKVIARIHQSLQHINSDDLLSEARVYGGGMVKLEPKELARVRFEWM